MSERHYGLPLVLPARLSRLHEWMVYGSFVLLWLSGLFWVLVHYGVSVADELPNPAEALWLKCHGAAAMIFLWVLGSLGPVHIRRAWRAGKHRFSGGLLLSGLSILLITGYFLYYSSDEIFRKNSSLVHILVGIFSFLPLLIHVLIAYRLRKYRN